MKMTRLKYVLCTCLLASVLCACHGPAKEKEEEKPQVVAEGTPVTVTTIGHDTLSEYIELNATSVFMQKHYVKANVNGYIQQVNAVPGKYVAGGQVLFVLKTKEAQSIDNSINKLNSSFRFSGVNNIKASGSGYITQLNHQAGDYVQDGEQLAVISDESSFAFLLNLPFELRQYVKTGYVLDMTLPDGTKLKGHVTESLPTVDPTTQAQSIVLKTGGSSKLPENLVARVRIVKANKTMAFSLPKGAVLTNDVQSDFWVMKMTDSVTAVKVPVKKGIETNDRVEILEPVFKPGDKILLTGNFGLPDTARVKITE